MQIIVYGYLIFLVVLAIRKGTSRKVISIILLFAISQLVLVTFLLKLNFSNIGILLLYSAVVAILVIACIVLQVFPDVMNSDINNRTKIVYGGKILLDELLLILSAQILVLVMLCTQVTIAIPPIIFWGHIIVQCLVDLTIWLNGWLRIIICSKRLRFARRTLALIYIWVPIVNLFVIRYVTRIAKDEYDYACYTIDLYEAISEKSVCHTKYPILFLHGLGFRDLHYYNYWGRIPRALIEQGATVFHGHQEGFGTIADNAEIIKQKIFEIVQQTGCEKVNIIAHSKGGLDARYMITKLHMDKHVASLTTMSTPHQGSYLADFAYDFFSQKMYMQVAKIFDKTFLKFGDKNPQFYQATRELSHTYMKRFNEEVPNMPTVYYQSYAAKMKHCLSELLLSIPYLLMCRDSKHNDGLVTVESAKWGTFKGTFENDRYRGISHEDVIDLFRKDFKNFHVIEEYIKIVSELKAMEL